MIKVLVTGDGGQIAEELKAISKLIQNPWLQFKFYTKSSWDIADLSRSKIIFTEEKPHYIINTAAYTKVDLAEKEKDQCYLINSESPWQLASLCKEFNTRLIHFSSDYVFHDDQISIPLKEEHPRSPKSIYAKSKALGEDKVLKTNPESIIIRSSWVYSSFGHNFVKTMLRLSTDKSELNIVGDQIGSPTYAANIAELLLDIIYFEVVRGKKLSGVFHYANEGKTNWCEFAKTIFELKKIRITTNPITTKAFNAPAPRPHFSVLDCTKIKKTLGIQIPNWKDSLALCLSKIID